MKHSFPAIVCAAVAASAMTYASFAETPRITGSNATTVSSGFATAHAAVPFHETQSPGYYRMKLGQIEVTALSDGSSPLPVGQMLRNIEPAKLNTLLHESYLRDPVETSVNAFLINTGSHLVLIDTGGGDLLGPRQGKLLLNLRAAGYSPEQVDEVYITHMHGDHVGGLVADGKPAFPNAIVRASRQEAEFWLSHRNMQAAPQPAQSQFLAAMSAIQPYTEAGRFKPFDGLTTLVAGVTAQPAWGHTPGHTVYVIESGGEKLIVIGDLVHVAAVQFADPAVTIQFDTDSRMAVASRTSMLADATAHGYWLAGAHLAFPGLGHVRSSGEGYTFVPANYSGTP